MILAKAVLPSHTRSPNTVGCWLSRKPTATTHYGDFCLSFPISEYTGTLGYKRRPFDILLSFGFLSKFEFLSSHSLLSPFSLIDTNPTPTTPTPATYITPSQANVVTIWFSWPFRSSTFPPCLSSPPSALHDVVLTRPTHHWQRTRSKNSTPSLLFTSAVDRSKKSHVREATQLLRKDVFAGSRGVSGPSAGDEVGFF